MIFLNESEALNYIHSRGKFTFPAGLERMEKLLSALGDPQKRLPVIHIAGTNGKGSTATFCAAALRAAGYKTGLYISPFVLEFRERIQINGEMIPPEALCRLTERVKQTHIAVNEFELITAIGFLYFAEQRCDVVVLETGLGGRLDATNTASDVRVAVITKIGLDHTAILGDTLAKIAAEKCGIIKNCPTVSAPDQPPEAAAVIRATAKTLTVPDRTALKVLKCDLLGNEFTYYGVPYRTRLGGAYQIENALTAIEAIRHSGFAVSAKDLQQGLENATFPARLEVLSRSPLVVLDGAHNPDGAAALAKTIQPFAGEITAVVGMMRDKNADEVLKTLLPLCKTVFTVRASDSDRAFSAVELAEKASAYHENVTPAESIAQALTKAEAPTFIFGSLYLASAVKALQKSGEISFL